MSHPSLWDPITFGAIDKAADQFGLVKGSDGVTRRMAAEEILDRLLSSDDLSWMSAFANFAALASGDGFLVLDDDASAVKLLPSSAVMNRLLSSGDISWMSALANLAAVDGASDSFIVWDASASAFKKLTAEEVLLRLAVKTVPTAHTSDATLTSAANYSVRTNRGASGLITFTTWAPTAGQKLAIGRIPEHPVRVKGPAGVSIHGHGNGEYIELLDRGRVYLECEEDDEWEIAYASCLVGFEP